MTAVWRLLRDDQTFGPYTEEQMKQFVQEGRVTATDMVWKPDMEKWIPAEQASFFAHFQPPQPARPEYPATHAGHPTVQAKARKPLSGGKIFGLIMISIMVFFTGWFWQIGLGVERTAFNENYYQRLLKDTEVAVLLQQSFVDNLGVPGAGAQMAEVPDTSQIFSVEWIERQSLIVVEDFLAVLHGKQDTFTAVIDFQEPRAALQQHPNPEIQEEAAQMPDQMPLSSLLGEDERTWREFGQTISTVQTARNFFVYVPAVILAILLLFCMLLGGYARAAKWFGTTSMLSGLSLAALAQVLGFILIGMTSVDMAELQPVAGHLVNSLTVVFLVYGAAGMVLLGGGIFLGKKGL